MESLYCKEGNLFDACIAWAKASCQNKQLDENDSNNLRGQLGACFNLMRFRVIKNEEIDQVLSNKLYEGLFNKDELGDIIRLNLNKKCGFETIAPRPKLLLQWDKLIVN